MRSLILNWGVSKGRESAGERTINAYEYGRRVASAKGGGDLRGKVLAEFLTKEYGGRFPTPPKESFDALTAQAEAAGLGINLLSSSATRDVVAIEDRAH